jgi:hypothetical protein
MTDLEFVREAVLQFDVHEGSLEDYFGRYWHPDGVIDFVDGFPISGRPRDQDIDLELQVGNVYVGHERARRAALDGG